MSEYVYMWEYEVHPGSIDLFREHYGPQGTWVALFRKAPGYLATTLLQDRTSPTRFVTIDRWASEAEFASFRRDFAAEFERLDHACEALTATEVELGTFSATEPPR